ncbi:MAG: type II secretion system F family protein [Gemmatimonadetes bacterium]|nr:type II secretion system F family protein [Gemmatimonadota bacterium]
MPAFRFRTIDANGRRARGHAQAVSAAALVRDLEAQRLTVLDVRERGAQVPEAVRVNGRAVADAVQAMASLLAAGLPVARALDLTAEAAPRTLADVLQNMRARLERGESVAASMAAHPSVFSATAVGVVRAGERAGDLDGALARLAAQLEREESLRARLVSAAIYPAILTIAGGAAIVVLLLFVLPRFAALLDNTGIPLPASTAFLLGTATALRTYWIALPLAAIGALAALSWLRGSNSGRRAAAHALLALPVVGAFRRDLLAANGARALGVLLRGGSPLPAALDDAASAAADPLLRDALARARARVIAGSTLRAALAAEPVFDHVLISLVATGEEAGRLAEFLSRAADLFEQRAERGAQRLVALLEPTIIVVFGLVVGFVALSLLQAIYGINPSGLR